MRVVGLPPLGAARGARLTMLAPGLPVLPELLPAPEVASQLTSLLADSAISSTADDLAGSLFGASLFPWLAMLYWLKHPTVAAPPGVAFGLTFLLAFVFGTIPAAIGAGALYGVSLADADYLHGAAESLLAITNCVVVLGFRDALRTTGSATAAAAAATSGAAAAPAGAADDEAATARLRTAAYALGAGAALSAAAVLASGGAQVHTAWLGGLGNLPHAVWPAEPANALSVPTWIIHTSSLVEWLVAMGLAWRYADAVGTPQWKGVTWGMLPLHTSGIIACTYHLFFNAPSIAWCVALQAGMTCVGNTTLAVACLRLALASGWTWQMGIDEAKLLLASRRESRLAQAEGAPVPGTEASVAAAAAGGATSAAGGATSAAGGATSAAASAAVAPAEEGALLGWEDLGDAWSEDSDAYFLLKLAALSGGGAYAVKYVPALLQLDIWPPLPDGALSAAAITVIVVPTLLNCAKWTQRSKEDAEFIGDF